VKSKLQDINVITHKNQVNKQAVRMLKKHPIINQKLMEATSFLPNDSTIRIRVMCIIQNITEPVRCPVCGIPTTFNSSKGHFNKFCKNIPGKSCTNKHEETSNHRTQTLIDRYGVDNPMKSAKIRQKTKNTNIKRYGGVSPAASVYVKKKMRDTTLKRYGVTNVAVLPEIIEKRMNTNIERYGAPSHALSLKDEKTIADVLKYTYDKRWLTEQHITNKMHITAIAKLVGLTTTTLCKRFHDLDIPVYTYPSSQTVSSQELEFREFISLLIPQSVEVLFNERNVISPLELDIFIPRYNIAFEFCGIFWHSELHGRGRGYHLNKMKRCLDNNIRLIQVFSSEWNENRDLVKSRIQTIFQKNQRIFARKCVVKNIDTTQANAFLQLNHIQKSVNSTVQIGLVDPTNHDNILSLMTFGHPRFTQSNDGDRKSVV
jgi:hypothetical protein